MCVETLRTVLIFSEMIDFRGHMPRFTLRNEHFPTYLIRIARNVYWNLQNRVRFYKMIDLMEPHA